MDIKIGYTIKAEKRNELLQKLQRCKRKFTNIPVTTSATTHKINLCSDKPVISEPYSAPTR